MSDTMGFGNETDGKGKYIDARTEMYQAEQSLREKIRPHFERIITLHSDMVREQNRYFKEELEEFNTYTACRILFDMMDGIRKDVNCRSYLMGLKKKDR